MKRAVPGSPARIAVLLARGEVPALLRPFVGQSSAALLPVSGRPVIHRSLEYLHDQGVERVIVGMLPDDTRLAQFLEHAFGSRLDLQLIPVAEERGPGYTLLQCLLSLEDASPVLVVLGDTLFRFPPSAWKTPNRSFVLTSPVDDAARWCLADVSKDGLVTALADKPRQSPGGWPALIGVYYLADPRPARDALAVAAEGEARLKSGTPWNPT